LLQNPEGKLVNLAFVVAYMNEKYGIAVPEHKHVHVSHYYHRDSISPYRHSKLARAPNALRTPRQPPEDAPAAGHGAR